MPIVRGTPGNDILRGSGAADRVFGFLGDDLLFGQAGNDALFGGGDEDALRGESGNDVLDGGWGADLLDGGTGNDTATYAAFAGGVDVDLASGRAFTPGGTDVLIRVERVIATESADSIVGNDLANRLEGRAGEDFIGGGGGSDDLLGGSEADGLGGGDGEDRLFGESGDDFLDGGRGRDMLDGGTENDTIMGAEGDDRLFGRTGGDRLDGGDGRDRLEGESGDDRLNGGRGDDLLSGGASFDSFFYQVDLSAPDRDLITDFEVGSDVVACDNEFLFNEDLFHALDSNGSGRLDRPDRWVDVLVMEFEEASETSTVIDLGGLIASLTGEEYAPGSNTLALFGAVGLGEFDIFGI